MKKILTVFLSMAIYQCAPADGPITLIDGEKLSNPIVIGVPSTAEFEARTGPNGTLTVSNLTVTGTGIWPSPLYFGDIYTGNLRATNTVTISGDDVTSTGYWTNSVTGVGTNGVYVERVVTPAGTTNIYYSKYQ
jgi:hypothetical protein